MLPKPALIVLARTFSCVQYVAFVFLYLLAKVTLQPEISVLMYHSVGSNNSKYTVESTEFRRQIDHLVKNYQIFSLGNVTDFLEGKLSLPRKSVAITFDDGFLDVYLNAFPYFKRHNIPATIFVTTGCVEKEMLLGSKQLAIMSWSEIGTMSKNKFEIGAHTITHPNLTQICLDDAKQEILGSKREIEAKIGKEVRFFAYPSGAHNQALSILVKQLGFKGAVGGSGVVQKNSNIFALNRVEVDQSINFTKFKMRLTKAINYYSKLEQVLKKSFFQFSVYVQTARAYDNK